METIVKVGVNNTKITVTFYNTTQRVKIEGKGDIDIGRKVIIPLIKDRIANLSPGKIEQHNKDVIAVLSGKRKVILRPVRSVRYKSITKVPCTKCEITFLNNSQLSKHKKEEHKGIDNNSSTIINCFPLVDDLSLLDLTDIDVNEMPLIEDLINCEICEVELDSKVELEKHMKVAHGWRCNTVKQESSEVKTAPSSESQHSFEANNEKVIKDVTKDIVKEIVNKNVDKEIINKDCSEMVTCEVCEAKFANEKDYIVHKETHIISSTYQCEICAVEFSSETVVEKHVERTHTPDRIDEETSDIPIRCTKCSVFVKTQKDLETHHQLEHMTLKINVEASLDKFEVECNQCKNKCKLNIQLKAHTRKVHVQDPKL